MSIFDRWRKSRPTPVPALPAPSSVSLAGADPDRPITTSAEDKFGRVGLARVVARYVDATPRGQSVVFALTGAWGTGKTSVLHLIEKELTAAGTTHVIWFNPWLFSGSREIASNFLRELAVQLGQKDRDLKHVGDMIAGYGEFFAAAGELVGVAVPGLSWFARAASAVGAAGKAAATHANDSVRDARDRVEKALRASPRRFLVVIDDIDRLDRDEVREVFKLVRLVADFPNVSYLLSFDRRRVEQALDGGPEPSGRDYLAKIVQAAFDLPQLDRDVMRNHLSAEIDRALEGRTHGPFHEKDWPDILVSVIAPLVKTPRDARRFANAIAPVVELLGAEVALEDVLALEAIRLFLPDVLAALPQAAEHITLDLMSGSRHRRDGANVVQDLMKRAGDRSDVVRELLVRVFPASRFAIDNHHYGGEWMRKWRKERRVACREILDIYFERGIRTGRAPAHLVRDVAASFDDEAKVDALLEPLDPAQLEALLEHLLDFHEDLGGFPFENGMLAVLRHADRLRHGRAHFFDLGADLTVDRLVLWSLKAAPEARRRDAVASLLVQIHALTWKVAVVNLVVEHQVLAPEAIEPLRAAVREEILGANPERLLSERSPAKVIGWATFDDATSSYSPLARTLLADPRLLRRVLASEIREKVSGSFGSVRSEVQHFLPWFAFERLFGDEAALRERLHAVVALGPAADDDVRTRVALTLVNDLLEGRTRIERPATASASTDVEPDASVESDDEATAA